MQQGFTPKLKTQILEYFFNDITEPIPEPTPLFVGLFVSSGSAEPNELIIGNGGYNRASVTFATIPDSGTIRNVSSVDFPKATLDWTVGLEKITHIGIFRSHEVIDEESGTTYVSDEGDEMIACIQLPEPESVNVGETFQFNPQAITLQLI
jgi:hypothetical protein